MLPRLADLGIIENGYTGIADGLLNHINSSLVETEGQYPSIKAYEGPEETLKYILPRVGEAVAWKAALLSEFIIRQRDLHPELFPGKKME
jgi:hypothetical protein